MESIHQQIETERSVLGYLIQYPDSHYQLFLQLYSDLFMHEEHRVIYDTLVYMYYTNRVIDEHTLTETLKSKAPERYRNYVWIELIRVLKGIACHSGSVHSYITLLAEAFANQQLQGIALGMNIEEQSALLRIDHTLTALYELKKQMQKKHDHPLRYFLSDFMNEGFSRDESRNLKTGIKELDQLLCAGFEPGQLVVIGARPCNGLTHFVMNILTQALVPQNLRAAFISMRTPVNLFSKMLATNLSGKPVLLSSRHREGLQELSQLETEGRIRYHFHDSGLLDTLVSQIRYYKHINNIDAVIIDPIQYVNLHGNNSIPGKPAELNQVIKTLKKLAIELNIVVVCTSEVSRQAERNAYPFRPKMVHIKGCSAVEEFADKVLLLFRPEYYYFYEWEDGSSTLNQVEAIVAKNNNGTTGMIKMKYEKSTGRFSDLIQDAERNEITAPPLSPV